MSYFIANKITIYPDKIVYEGGDNNVFPRYNLPHEKPLTWHNMRDLVNDLIGYCIQPQQQWWKEVVEHLKAEYKYEDVCKNDEVAHEAICYLIALYNTRIIHNYHRLVKGCPSLKLELLHVPTKE